MAGIDLTLALEFILSNTVKAPLLIAKVLAYLQKSEVPIQNNLRRNRKYLLTIRTAQAELPKTEKRGGAGRGNTYFLEKVTGSCLSFSRMFLVMLKACVFIKSTSL